MTKRLIAPLNRDNAEHGICVAVPGARIVGGSLRIGTAFNRSQSLSSVPIRLDNLTSSEPDQREFGNTFGLEFSVQTSSVFLYGSSTQE